MKACDSYYCNPRAVHRLEVHRLRISADIRDCEQNLSNARDIIERLHETAKGEAVKLGLGLAVTAVVTLGEIIKKF